MPERDAQGGGAPYRETADGVRYLRTVCYRSASSAPGTCPRCHVPMLPLDNPEVVAMVRARVSGSSWGASESSSRLRRERRALLDRA